MTQNQTTDKGFLTTHEMRKKYNCSQETIYKFARTYKVPLIADVSRIPNYRFFPKYEEMFANREKRKGRGAFSKIVILQYPQKNQVKLHFFRNIKQGFLHTMKMGAHIHVFRNLSNRFKGFYNTLTEPEKIELNALISMSKTPQCIYAWAPSEAAPHVFINKPSLRTIETQRKLLVQFFSTPDHPAILIEQQHLENDTIFCNRLYTTLPDFSLNMFKKKIQELRKEELLTFTY